MRHQAEKKAMIRQLISEGRHSIPNLMSIFRILLIPFILILYLQGKGEWSVCIVILSALTDMFDGIVARRFNMVTDLGKALDPIADKLTLGAMMLCFALDQPWFFSVVIIMAIKEFSGLIMRWIIFRNGWGIHGAVWYGKVSTWVMYTTSGCFMVFENLPTWLMYGFIGLCVVSIAYATVGYTIQCARIMKKSREEQKG